MHHACRAAPAKASPNARRALGEVARSAGGVCGLIAAVVPASGPMWASAPTLKVCLAAFIAGALAARASGRAMRAPTVASQVVRAPPARGKRSPAGGHEGRLHVEIAGCCVNCGCSRGTCRHARQQNTPAAQKMRRRGVGFSGNYRIRLHTRSVYSVGLSSGRSAISRAWL